MVAGKGGVAVPLRVDELGSYCYSDYAAKVGTACGQWSRGSPSPPPTSPVLRSQADGDAGHVTHSASDRLSWHQQAVEHPSRAHDARFQEESLV